MQHKSKDDILKRHPEYLPLFAKIDSILLGGNTLKVAIDGGSASGKTTLGKILKDIYDCTLFCMDDFFLQEHQRTPARFNEVGGNVDYERFLSEVLIPLKTGDEICYRKFDCQTKAFLDPVKIVPKKLIVTEGSYSMHPALEKHYDFSVFLDISKQTQTKRILSRNTPEVAERFFNTWIELEDIYFEKTDIKNRCDMIIQINAD